MPRNVYSEINLHITWHTKKRAAMIVDGIERQLFQFIQHKIAETSGVELHAIGGTADHVHLAVSVPPTLNISEWIGQIKGVSAHYVNHRIANRRVLEWDGVRGCQFRGEGAPLGGRVYSEPEGTPCEGLDARAVGMRGTRGSPSTG